MTSSSNARQLSATVTSIQGERATRDTGSRYADPGVVEDYAARVSDEIAKCRQSGHNYPPLLRGKKVMDQRPDGLLVRRSVCLDCGCAVQEQIYQPVSVRQGNTWVYGVEYVESRTSYQENARGERYTAEPGHGRITPRAFRSVVASQGIDDDFVRDALKQRRKFVSKHLNQQQ